MIDLTEIDIKYKDKCSLIKAGKCKNVNIFIEQSRKMRQLEEQITKIKQIALQNQREGSCAVQILEVITESEF